MPVSIVTASFGVDCGTWRILFMMLFMIVCIFWLSLCVVVLLSAPRGPRELGCRSQREWTCFSV